MKKLLLLAASLWLTLPGWAQDSTRHAYAYFSLENDGFQIRAKDVTDRYFTNGVRVGMQSTAGQRNPFRRLLLHLPASLESRPDHLYGFEIGQEIYTPRSTSQRTPKLYPYDRPYAGYLFTSWSLVATDRVRATRLTSALTLGMIGPVSGASEVQNGMHRHLKQKSAEGWVNQLRNDPVISYSARWEARPFAPIHPAFDLTASVETTVGTLTNSLGLGGMLRIGRFNDYFQSASGMYDDGASVPVRKIQVYAYVRPVFQSVLDNSLLGGGWLNGSRNYYALPSVELEHFYWTTEYGWVAVLKNFRLALTQCYRGKEFRTGAEHYWGKISLTARVR